VLLQLLVLPRENCQFGIAKPRLIGLGHGAFLSNAVKPAGRFNTPDDSVGAGLRHQMCDAAIHAFVEWSGGMAITQTIEPSARTQTAPGVLLLILPSKPPVAAFERLSVRTAAGMAWQLGM
jgi:hypothetical protein